MKNQLQSVLNQPFAGGFVIVLQIECFMNKIEAIILAKAYINDLNLSKPASIDTYSILDESPQEFKKHWCFKAYFEDLNPMRGDDIKINGVFPFYLISKETKSVVKANRLTYEKLI